MFTKRAKWVMLLGSIIVILTCGLGCVTLTDNLSTKDPSEKLPIRTLSIQIEENQREELFAQLRKFSEKHHFSFDLSFYKGKEGNEIFSVEMYGEGLEILALSKPIHTTELDFDFFEQDPASPPQQETVDELYNDLKIYVSEIPGIVIVGE